MSADLIVLFKTKLISGVDFFNHLPAWAADAVLDSLKIIPFLFIVFVFIEIFEYFYADKLNRLMSSSKKAGPLLGSFAAIIPQCGLSIIAATLYTRKIISMGTLIAIYLATSDEALPVLSAHPEKSSLILPVIIVKLVIAVLSGYLIDFIFKSKTITAPLSNQDIPEEGCCKHDIITKNKTNLWLHPLMHTFNVFAFVLIITFILNYFVNNDTVTAFLTSSNVKFGILEPVITAFVGLIPNCAVSIGLVVMLINGTLSFGSAMAGLCSNAGLGLLVLLRKNENIKNSLLIILLLLGISIAAGISLQFIEVFKHF